MLRDFCSADVFLVCGYTDMRRGIDGLVGIIKQNYKLDPCSGNLFLFCGKRRDRLKALLWEEDGFLLLYNFLKDGRIELTNNRAERAIKPFVIGRKNWLFSDTDKGAEASSMCYSLIESAKLNNLDVYGYLLYLLTELPKLAEQPQKDRLDRLLPWAELPDYCYI